MGRQRPPKQGLLGEIVDAIFGATPQPSRQKSVSSKNVNRTGGQSKGGVGKNATHLSPAKKAQGKTEGSHSVKGKGQRGSQGTRGAR